jgi:hypothetical protein
MTMYILIYSLSYCTEVVASKLALVKRMVCGASYLEVKNRFHISLLLPKKPFVATVQGKGDLSHWLSDSKCSAASDQQYRSMITSPIP